MLATLKRYFMAGLAVSLLLLGLAACGSDEPVLGIGRITATPTGAAISNQTTAAPVTTPRLANADKGRLVDIFPELGNLSDNATGLNIQDNWTGLNQIAPIVTNYSLKRSGGLLEGEGLINAGSYAVNNRSGISKIIKVSIPTDTTNEFLRLLAETPVEAGPYRGSPIATHTDDYPDLNFSVTLPGGTLSFGSASQRGDFYPWTIWYGGKQYTSTDGTPHKAYSKLASYLKLRDTLNIIRSEIDFKLTATPRP